jgi:hypothetical protein
MSKQNSDQSVREAIKSALGAASDQAASHDNVQELTRLRRIANQFGFAWARGYETLYKFKSLSRDTRERDLDILKSSRIYFPTPDQFNDPLDCWPVLQLAGDPKDENFVRGMLDKQNQIAKRQGLDDEDIAILNKEQGVPIEVLAAKATDHIRAQLRKNTRLLCLTAQQLHPLQWSHYAGSHFGFCIHFDCRSGGPFGTARQVHYMRNRTAIGIPLESQTPDDIARRMVFEKANFWRYEKEFRLVAHDEFDWGRKDHDHFLYFDPQFVTGITCGMRITDEDEKTLVELATKDREPIPVWKCFEDQQKYRLVAKRIV